MQIPPYQSFSTYALNPYLIDPEFLIRDGLLKKQDCEALDFGKKASFVDYGLLFQNRRKLLLKAFRTRTLLLRQIPKWRRSTPISLRKMRAG